MQQLIKRGLVITVDDDGFARANKRRVRQDTKKLPELRPREPVTPKARPEQIRDWYKVWAN
jgi:hypothetical protein